MTFARLGEWTMAHSHAYVETLIGLIERFVGDDGDRSIAAANRIEVALDELLGEDERFEDVVTALAPYRPFGGEGLVGEEEITRLLRWVLGVIRSL